MRNDTKSRLDRAIRLQWMKRAGYALAGLGLVAGGFWLTGLDATSVNRRVPGVVVAVGPLNTNNTQSVENGLAVDVKLADGRTARVMALKTTDPHMGDKVEITEHVHGTGRSTFSWK